MNRPRTAISIMLRSGIYTVLAVVLSLSASAQSSAPDDRDWPAWRHDAAHSGTTPRPLAERLYLNWTLELPTLRPGWPDQPRVQMDALYEPIVVGQKLFLPSARNDGVSAIDTRSGETIWTFTTDAPVRYSPVAWDGNPFRPFCGERCRLVDLGAWVTERYRVPGDAAEHDDEPGSDEGTAG